MIDEKLIDSINQTLKNILSIRHIITPVQPTDNKINNLLFFSNKIIEVFKTPANQRVTLENKLLAELELKNNKDNSSARKTISDYSLQQERALLERINLIKASSSDKLQLAILIEFFDRLAHTTFNKIASISYEQKESLMRYAIEKFPEDAFVIPSNGIQNSDVSFLFYIDDKNCLTWHSKDQSMLSEDLPDKFYTLAINLFIQLQSMLTLEKGEWQKCANDKVQLKKTFMNQKIPDKEIRRYLDELAYGLPKTEYTNSKRIDLLIAQEQELQKTEFVGGGSYENIEHDLTEITPIEPENIPLKSDSLAKIPEKVRTSDEIKEIIMSSDNETIQYLLSLSDPAKSYYGCNLSELINLENLHLANKNGLITQQELSEQRLYILDSIVSSCTSHERIKIKTAKTKNSEKKFITLHLEFSKTLKPLIWEIDNDTAEMLLESHPDKISEISGVNKEDNNLEILKRLSEKEKTASKATRTKNIITIEEASPKENIQSSRSETEIWNIISSANDEKIKKLLELSNTEKQHYGCNLSELIKLEILQVSKDAELINSKELSEQKLSILHKLIKSCDDPNRIKIKSVKTKKSEKKFVIFHLELSKTLKPLSWEIDDDTAKFLLDEFSDKLSQIDGVNRENCNLEILNRLYEKKHNIQKKGIKKSTTQITEQTSTSAEEHIAEQKNNPLLEIANASLDNFLSYPDVAEKIKEIYERMDPHSKATWGFILSLFSTEEEKSRFNNEYKPENRNGGMEK